MSEFIYKVTCSLNGKEWVVIVNEYACTEGPKAYTLPYHSKVIKKAKLLKPDTMFIPMHGMYSFFTYCLKEDIELAKETVKDRVMFELDKVIRETEQVKAIAALGVKELPLRECESRKQ